jgi:hypothetical protein
MFLQNTLYGITHSFTPKNITMILHVNDMINYMKDIKCYYMLHYKILYAAVLGFTTHYMNLHEPNAGEHERYTPTGLCEQGLPGPGWR